MKRFISCLVLIGALSGCGSMQGAPSATASCGRACLKTDIDLYLAALLAHDPSRLPLAKQVRFTEDTHELPLGGGFWKTVTGERSYRQDFLDVHNSTAGALVVMTEGDHPVLLVLRLKVVGRRIGEIETMVVHNAKEGAFMDIEALKTATVPMNLPVPAGQRETRDNAIAIAARYPGGLKIGSFVKADTAFAPDTYRFENGRRMAGPGCTFMPPGCVDIKKQRIPTLSEITWRVAAVDEEQGIVWFRLDFGPGSMGPKENALHAWEAFKVYGGQIHAVEAFMKVMPAHLPSGWD
ncbi:MAG: hypothetical protein WDM77_09015 [Steroidobacteraceae bacterium]